MNLAKTLDYVEKRRYLFKAYPRTKAATVFFPGCSFPSQFPRTNEALVKLVRELGMGVVYDCCGRSFADFREEGVACDVLEGLTKRLGRHGVERLVTACPNCLDYLQGRLPGIEVVDVYTALDDLGFTYREEFPPGELFIPCPDKLDHALSWTLRRLYPMDQVHTLGKVGCCGLSPQIAIRGPEAQRAATELVFKRAEGRTVYTYCASCLGQFGRLGHRDVRHVLSVILGVDEKPDVAKAVANRVRHKFERRSALAPLSKGE